jgi:hypothetical protein
MARRGEVDELGPDALDASDEGARQLAEGRYSKVAGEQPRPLERVFTRPRSRWQPHLHGWGCVRCGPSVHSRTSAHRHDWWHRWLEAMFAAIGSDVDQLEGELSELRAETEARMGEAEAASAAAVEQVRVLTQAFGPALARLLDEGGRVVVDK